MLEPCTETDYERVRYLTTFAYVHARARACVCGTFIFVYVCPATACHDNENNVCGGAQKFAYMHE